MSCIQIGTVRDKSDNSFFTNPVVDGAAADALPDRAPRYPQPDGRVKTRAAWLIQHAGFAKGHGTDRCEESLDSDATREVALARPVRPPQPLLVPRRDD